ncbi:MAG: SDR family oxidoreductase [Mogibacterium sp.]|nr:SDR family oxidoreductase [Mogibacterium sp.]
MIVMITGTSGGIGSAIARLFLERGHEVYGIDIADSIIEHERYTHCIADVTDLDEVEAALPQGFRPEILINNAGVQESGKDIDINLRAVINVTEKYAVDNDRIRSVVNIGSASGHTGSEFPEYAASKGGILAYTKNVALRIAPRAICNSIDPGGVTTELNRIVMDDPALWNRIMELTPLKRWASPEEIAEWVYFVAVTNRFMTGQNLLIDGGEAGRAEFVWPE